MEIAFFCADKERETRLADAFIQGLSTTGEDFGYKVYKSAHASFGDADAICMVGVKSLDLFKEARKAGKHVIYFDKGYFRHRGPNRTWEYWRVCIDDHHPTDYVGRAKHGEARWKKLAHRRLLEMKLWRDDGLHIVYAGSSDKYHKFVGLPPPTECAQDVVRRIRKITQRKIIYRPKPTWLEAEPIKGAEFSGRDQDIGTVLRGAWCLVTYGSNSTFEAILQGIPCIVLGNGIAAPISSHTLDDIESKDLCPSYVARDQWLWNLGWCMFSEEEMKLGLAWAALKPQFTGDVVDDRSLPYVAGRPMKPTKAMQKRLSSMTREEYKEQRAATKQRKLQKRMNKIMGKGYEREEGDGGVETPRRDTPDKPDLQEA